jgi:hypothetical protein
MQVSIITAILQMEKMRHSVEYLCLRLLGINSNIEINVQELSHFWIKDQGANTLSTKTMAV